MTFQEKTSLDRLDGDLSYILNDLTGFSFVSCVASLIHWGVFNLRYDTKVLWVAVLHNISDLHHDISLNSGLVVDRLCVVFLNRFYYLIQLFFVFLVWIDVNAATGPMGNNIQTIYNIGGNKRDILIVSKTHNAKDHWNRMPVYVLIKHKQNIWIVTH